MSAAADPAGPRPERRFGALGVSLLAVVTGAVAGLGAIVFRGLIAVIHNLFFLGTFSFAYDATVHTPPSPWGPAVVLVPVIGAVGVSFLVTRFAPEAKGHGVPEVMDATYYHRGVIRPVVAVVKSLASALSIGTGGSVGREGPIAQIGSSFGSSLGQWLRLPYWQRVTLIAGGAGGAIAATFNTPVGGLLFAIELMLHELSVRTLVPVTISTVTAAYVGRLAFGDHPSFTIPALDNLQFSVTSPLLLLTFIPLGALLGLVSVLYIRSIYSFEDLFEGRIRSSYYLRHALGMLAVGVMMYVLLRTTGYYYIQGVGYATVQDILSGLGPPLYLLLILFVLKLLATALTLGSGASGGIFSPALFMGATLGAAYGEVLHRLAPGMVAGPVAFAVAGMAGVLGGSTGAAVTAIVIIFEMTLDYNVIIPMTITVAMSYGIRKALLRDSIYTMKLTRRGHYMPESMQADLHFRRRAEVFMDRRFAVAPASWTLEELLRAEPRSSADEREPPLYVLVADDDGRVTGVVEQDEVLEAAERDPHVRSGHLTLHDYVVVPPQTQLLSVLGRLRTARLRYALVAGRAQEVDPGAGVDRAPGSIDADRVAGIITIELLADTLTQGTEIFSD